MNKFTTLLIIFASVQLTAQELNLICKGEATVPSNQVSSSTARVYGNGSLASGTGTNIISRDTQVYAEIILKIADDFSFGTIKLPSVMRPPIGGKNVDTWELDINANDEEIRGAFRINMFNKPKITISRVTGRMEYKAGAWPKNFSGDCETLDVTKKKF